MKTILKITTIVIVALLSFITSSCNNDEPKIDQPTIASRTILVYMVSNNSLGYGGFDSNDLSEMIEASQYSDFNGGRLIVYLASIYGNPALYEITNGNVKTLKTYSSSTLSVEAKRMQEVINDTKEIAPANDYGLILWSHGNGWRQTGISEELDTPTASKNILAFGEDQGKQMNITTLAQVINDEDFSFIYFDCCYMATIEVAYELRNATPFIIASATEVLADGMPYEHNIPLLFEDSPNLKGACANTFDFYNCKDGVDRSCTISLINTHYISDLAQASSQIYKLQTSLPEDFTPQKFTLDSKCYYFDFAQYIEALSSNHPQLLEDWQNALNQVVIYKNETPYMWGILPLEHHCGLSTYIINNKSNYKTNGYDQLQWWNDVVKQPNH